MLEFIESIQSKGEYTFSYDEALQTLGSSNNSLRLALHRLITKRKIIRLYEKFYLIVPLEYSKAGILPATWFIDDLMNHLQCDYYVGLLSAAALQSAGHQQPQQFQVMVNKYVYPIQKARADIKFFKKSTLSLNQKSKIKTPTGYMWISKPEVTAIDLVTYIKHAGYLNNVATILTELLEKLDPKELLLAAQDHVAISILQRLGFLLDYCGGQAITHLLYDWLEKQERKIVALRPDRSIGDAALDKKWKILINDIIEVDE